MTYLKIMSVGGPCGISIIKSLLRSNLLIQIIRHLHQSRWICRVDAACQWVVHQDAVNLWCMDRVWSWQLVGSCRGQLCGNRRGRAHPRSRESATQSSDSIAERMSPPSRGDWCMINRPMLRPNFGSLFMRNERAEFCDREEAHEFHHRFQGRCVMCFVNIKPSFVCGRRIGLSFSPWNWFDVSPWFRITVAAGIVRLVHSVAIIGRMIGRIIGLIFSQLWVAESVAITGRNDRS